MDPVTMTIISRAIGMALLIIGGIAALYYGHRIYRSRIRHAPEKADLHLGSFRISARGVGAIVMMTAAFWAYMGVRIAPNLKTGSGNTEVYAFQTDKGTVTAPALAIAADIRGDDHPSDNQTLVLFNEAIKANSMRPGHLFTTTIGGRAAAIEPVTSRIMKDSTGKTTVSASLKSAEQEVELSYAPTWRKNEVIFTPVIKNPVDGTLGENK